jgi:trehalose 6-phosphate phosphatase
MKWLLARSQHELLEQIAWSRVLLAFDFDGTLAPIVAVPSTARMRARTQRLLTQLCARYPCAVISGRARADVAARLGAASVAHVVGNHGLEPGPSLHRAARAMARAHAALATALDGVPGVVIEDKRYTLAVHYRLARRPSVARATIARAVATLADPVRLVPGKRVVNVVPLGAPDKGDAVLRLRRAERAAMVLYVGDDATDEDVFRLDQPGRLVAVRVGRSFSSSADYFLRDQGEMDALLSHLVALRATGDPA